MLDPIPQHPYPSGLAVHDAAETSAEVRTHGSARVVAHRPHPDGTYTYTVEHLGEGTRTEWASYFTIPAGMWALADEPEETAFGSGALSPDDRPVPEAADPLEAGPADPGPVGQGFVEPGTAEPGCVEPRAAEPGAGPVEPAPADAAHDTGAAPALHHTPAAAAPDRQEEGALGR
ncbi:hypothetical protein GCM10027570_38600 [Streptomonospora sediminis]